MHAVQSQQCSPDVCVCVVLFSSSLQRLISNQCRLPQWLRSHILFPYMGNNTNCCQAAGLFSGIARLLVSYFLSSLSNLSFDFLFLPPLYLPFITSFSFPISFFLLLCSFSLSLLSPPSPSHPSFSLSLLSSTWYSPPLRSFSLLFFPFPLTFPPNHHPSSALFAHSSPPLSSFLSSCSSSQVPRHRAINSSYYLSSLLSNHISFLFLSLNAVLDS